MLKIKLKKIRQEKNMSQRTLAKLSGVGKTTISDIENNLKSPSLTTVYKLSLALEIDWKEFIYLNK